MLTATIDESGTHENAPILCVAACVATSTQWKLFRQDWLPILGKVEFPREVRHRKYHASKRWFSDVNPELARLINRRMDVVFAVTIPYADFRDIAPAPFLAEVGGEYAIGVTACIQLLQEWVDGYRRKDTKIAYLVEAGHKNSSRVEEAFKALLANPALSTKWKVAKFDWGGKDDLILHPPDLVSHELASCYGSADSPVLTTLKQSIRHYRMDPADMKRNVDEIMELLPQWRRERRERRRRLRG